VDSVGRFYDLLTDPNESYDTAQFNPDLVGAIRSRVETLLTTFPEPVLSAWKETAGRRVFSTTSGSLPIEETP